MEEKAAVHSPSSALEQGHTGKRWPVTEGHHQAQEKGDVSLSLRTSGYEYLSKIWAKSQSRSVISTGPLDKTSSATFTKDYNMSAGSEAPITTFTHLPPEAFPLDAEVNTVTNPPSYLQGFANASLTQTELKIQYGTEMASGEINPLKISMHDIRHVSRVPEHSLKCVVIYWRDTHGTSGAQPLVRLFLYLESEKLATEWFLHLTSAMDEALIKSERSS
jgi:hypothetical protein